MTTQPAIDTVSITVRIASTAAWSAAFLSPRPIHRPAAIAAASVTRTSSSARLRSGALEGAATHRSYWGLHPVGSLHADEVERARQHGLRRLYEAEPEGLLLALEDPVVVVEAVEVVREPDRVVRKPVWGSALGGLRHDVGELDQPLDQVALLRRRVSRVRRSLRVAGIPEDPRDPGVRVLDVVDGVLLAPLPRQVDVDVDRLVMSARDEVPARGVHADLVHELVEEDDVAAPLGRLLRLAAFDDVDELVDQRLEPVRVVAEHRGGRLEAGNVAVVVGAEDVDQPVEAALELVPDIGHIRGVVEVAAVGRALERSVLVVAERAGSRPERSLRLVGLELGQGLLDLERDLPLEDPRVEVDPERVQLALDLVQHPVDRVAGLGRDLRDVLARVALLRGLLAPPPGLDGLAEELDLTTDVVEVVLALDLVARELEQASDGVAVRTVPCGADGQRAGRVRRDHLDLHALGRPPEAAAVHLPRLQDLAECLRVPSGPQEEVEETRARHLGALDGLELRRFPRELLRQLTGRPAVLRPKPQSDVRRVVAVLGAAWPLKRHRRAGEALEGRLEGENRVFRDGGGMS